MKKLIALLLSLLGVSTTVKSGTPEKSIILIEDNYLMVEFISNKNINFAKKEIKRISKFGTDHQEGIGYSSITEIKQIPITTIELNISTEQVMKLLESIGLVRYTKLMYFGMNGLTEISNPQSIVYGELKSGIFIEQKNNTVKHIWFDSQNWKELKKTKILDGFKLLGENYDLILVDWASEQIVDLKSKSKIMQYISSQQ